MFFQLTTLFLVDTHFLQIASDKLSATPVHILDVENNFVVTILTYPACTVSKLNTSGCGGIREYKQVQDNLSSKQLPSILHHPMIPLT